MYDEENEKSRQYRDCRSKASRTLLLSSSSIYLDKTKHKSQGHEALTGITVTYMTD